MKTKNWLVIGGAALGLCLASEVIGQQNPPGQPPAAPDAPAGGRQPGGGLGAAFAGGNFDPAQFQKMIVDNMRDQFEVTDDAEWAVISERLGKVFEARMKVGLGGGMGMMNMMNRRGNNPNDPNGGRRRGGGALAGMFAPGPEAETLQKAIDAKASKEELKAAVAAFVEARKQKQAALEKSQAELRALLSARQEAIAYSLGLL